MTNVLVAGGAGYIGSHVCKALSQVGIMPVVIDSLVTGYADFVKWGPLIIGDLSDTTLVAKTLKDHNIDAVIHLAGSCYVGESVKNPLKYYSNNLISTISLLQAMKIVGVKKLIFSSTCATYGTPNLNIINEETPQNPINPYGKSKLFIEAILKDVHAAGELDFVGLRYFNAAGADEKIDIGEAHDPETHLIPLAIKSALGGETLKIFGNDYATSDGTAVRDYLHVSDIADAHLASLKHLDKGGESTFVNLGTGCGTSVLDIIKAIQKIGIYVKYEFADRREGDPPKLVADNEYAFNLLNWSPSRSEISNILDCAVKWELRSKDA